ESDEAFLRRLSRELRGTEPTPAEVHFFVSSRDAGKREKLIDLFIAERQSRQKTQGKVELLDLTLPLDVRDKATLVSLDTLRLGADADLGVAITLLRPAALDALQKQFYEGLHAAKDRGDVARATQEYLDRLAQYVKDHPKNEDIPQAMLQIIRIYESRGKTVEAGAWREKLLKEHPGSAAAKAVK